MWRDKLAGGFTNSTEMSGDEFSALTYLWNLAMQPPADLATAAAFGQRCANSLSAGKTPNTPYVDFTKN